MNSWLRTKSLPPQRLTDGMMRYYIDAVRSDGAQFRAGIDVPVNTRSESEIGRMLENNLDYFLPKTMRVNVPGVDAHKGEDGWVENGAGS